MSQKQTVHGVFLEVLGIGILLSGESGIGKSELALSLLYLGHRLIADDTVELERLEEALIGRCPPILQDYLEVRGIGLVNVRAMFGDQAIRDSRRLQLIVRLEVMNHRELANIDRLHGMHNKIDLLGVLIPEVTLPVAPGRNLGALVEVAVRNQMLKMTGYDAGQLFIERQSQSIEEES